MNVLLEAATGVENAWCKASLRKEAESKAAGDTFCAVGHMGLAIAKDRGLTLSLDGSRMGPADKIARYDKLTKKIRRVERAIDEVGKVGDFKALDELYEESHGLSLEREPLSAPLDSTYSVVSESPEGKALAKTIIEDFPERLGLSNIEYLLESEHYDDVIWQFNDEDETTREEVVLVMRKASEAL